MSFQRNGRNKGSPDENPCSLLHRCSVRGIIPAGREPGQCSKRAAPGPPNPLIDDYNLVNSTTSAGGSPAEAIATATPPGTNVLGAMVTSAPSSTAYTLNGTQYIWMQGATAVGFGSTGGGNQILTPSGSSAVAFVRYDGQTTTSGGNDPSSLLTTTGFGGTPTVPTPRPGYDLTNGGQNSMFTFGSVRTGVVGPNAPGSLIVTFYSVDAAGGLDASQATFTLVCNTNYGFVDFLFSGTYPGGPTPFTAVSGHGTARVG